MSLDFLKALLVLVYLILSIKHELNIQTSYGTFLSVTTAKMFFLSSLLISLCYESIKGVSYTRTNISTGESCFIDTSEEV